MSNVLVPIGHHRPAAIPSAAADDHHLGGQKRIRRAHDRSDIHVVLPILDRHGELVSTRIEVGDNRCDRPISVLVEDVAAVAVREQLRIESRVGGPRLPVRPNADGEVRRGVVGALDDYSRPRSASE